VLLGFVVGLVGFTIPLDGSFLGWIVFVVSTPGVVMGCPALRGRGDWAAPAGACWLFCVSLGLI
jgi:hypothetical protein